jgi:hypothetical protein
MATLHQAILLPAPQYLEGLWGWMCIALYRVDFCKLELSHFVFNLKWMVYVMH